MRTLARFSRLLVILLPITVLWSVPSVVFALPKDRKAALETKISRSTNAEPARPHPVAVDEGELISPHPAMSSPPPAPRYLGPSRVETAASPYVDVRVGIPETPGGNNHMRRQVAVSPNGAVHMVYRVFNADSDGVVRNPVDSNRNGLYFYNAYNCDGADSLRFANSDPNRFGLQMAYVPGGMGDLRPRVMQQGGIFVPPGTSAPVVYGNLLIERTDLGNGFFSRRGWATMRDGASCLGLFTMDTSATTGTYQHPVMYPLNESTWVATFRDNLPEGVGFSYTTDQGASWSAVSILPTNSPWFNATEITGHNNTFYIVSAADPNDPTAFETTERPVYLKGTYNPGTGTIAFGTETEITGSFEQPEFLTNFIDLGATMIGDTLHVSFTDWNNWLGNGFPGPGGHVHHAAVLPDGTILGPNKIANINIDGRLPDRSTTLFGFAVEVWVMNDLVYNPDNGVLYCLWSAPPDNGNFGWADYEQYGVLACYDIFLSASPDNGRDWDAAQNVTQTDHPGCNGTTNPCEHEDFFVAAEQAANDTVWVVALDQAYPGIQEQAIASGIAPDPGPPTQRIDKFRLYKVPARALVATVRGDLNKPPGDTLKLSQIVLKPRGGIFSTTLRLSNIGLLSFFLDSVRLDPGLNDGFLATTTNAVGGTFISVGGAYDFQVSFNTNGVGPTNTGLRTGFLKAYIRSGSNSVALTQYLSVYVVPAFCLNHKITIHSGNNFTDVGTQGSIKDQGGQGMYYPSDGSYRFYDGGVLIANSSLRAAAGVPNVPRKVTRQLFGDKFLRCVADGILDSVAGTGGSYYNLFLKSIGTDVEDTTIVWQNIWEQSTHPDSSDFLIQTTRVINIGSTPIDSVAMGVLYDVDVQGISSAGQNVGGNTIIPGGDGRYYYMGWISDYDYSCTEIGDYCTRYGQNYGFVVIPSTSSNPGDTVGPHGSVVYWQTGFAYNIGNTNVFGGDSLAQRYAWNLNGYHSTENPSDDTLTGVNQRCYGGCSGPGFAAYINDMGYLAIAKKVYNFPVSGGGQNAVARYGLDGLAASVDTFFSGPGESYTVIHVASVDYYGLSNLIQTAQKGIAWYNNHVARQVGTSQTWLKGDLNKNGILSPSDVVLELNDVFLGQDATPWPPSPSSLAIPVCVADLNNDATLSPADVVLLLQGTYLYAGCPLCLRPCI